MKQRTKISKIRIQAKLGLPPSLRLACVPETEGMVGAAARAEDKGWKTAEFITTQIWEKSPESVIQYAQ